MGHPDAQGHVLDSAEQLYSLQLYLERGGAETRVNEKTLSLEPLEGVREPKEG